MPGVEVELVDMIREPSCLPFESEVLGPPELRNKLHGASDGIPTLAHDTTTGVPRVTSFGCTMSDASETSAEGVARSVGTVGLNGICGIPEGIGGSDGRAVGGGSDGENGEDCEDWGDCPEGEPLDCCGENIFLSCENQSLDCLF